MLKWILIEFAVLALFVCSYAVFRFIHPPPRFQGTIEQVKTWPGETRYTQDFTRPTERY